MTLPTKIKISYTYQRYEHLLAKTQGMSTVSVRVLVERRFYEQTFFYFVHLWLLIQPLFLS